MNFHIFTLVAQKEYNKLGDFFPYTFNDCLRVFRYYFLVYTMKTGELHPPLKGEQIRRIMDKMPFIEADRGCTGDPEYEYLQPEEYFILIDKYFKTPFALCDRNINHFFSGNIRTLRYLEADH